MDLLFRNFPYFVEVYFNFSFSEYILVFLLLIMVFVGIHFLHRGHRKNTISNLFTVVFAAYLSTVICITLLNQNRGDCRQILLNPLIELRGLSGELGVHYLRGMASNVILFIPLGILVSLSTEKRKIFYSCFWGFACSIAIETAQYVFQKGVTESIDVICNVLGAHMGASLVSMITILRKRKRRNA